MKAVGQLKFQNVQALKSKAVRCKATQYVSMLVAAARRGEIPKTPGDVLPIVPKEL